MSDKWICTNCGAECEDNFCTRCGSPRPVVEPAPQPEPIPADVQQMPTVTVSVSEQPELQEVAPAPQVDPIPEGVQQAIPAPQTPEQQTVTAIPPVSAPQPQQAAPAQQAQQVAQAQQAVPNTEPQPQQTAQAQQVPVQQAIPNAQQVSVQPVSAEKKSKKKIGLIIGIIAGAVVLIAAAVLVYFFVFAKDYKVNQYSAESPLPVTEQFALLTDSEQDLAVLYPDYLEASVQDNGAYIYGEPFHEGCSIKMNRYSGKESPKHYFKNFNAELSQEYSNLAISSINEVEVEDKTLYMVETHIPDLDYDLQQYIELYPDYYITYTSTGYENGAENTELYYAIATLRPSADAYEIPPEPEPVAYENEMGNFSITVPGKYSINEFKSGLYAESKSAGLFASYFNSDPLGAIIYDKEDFISQAESIDNYVATILGVNSVTFSNGKTEKINGKDFSCYPMTVILQDGTEASGKFCVADSDKIGCYFMCYYLLDEAAAEEGEAFLKSMKIKGSPTIADYTVIDASDHRLGTIAIKSALITKHELQDLSLALRGSGDEQIVLLEVLDGPEVKDVAQKAADEIAKKYEIEPKIDEVTIPDEGRYYFDAYEIKYQADGKDRTYRIVGIAGKSGSVYCMHFDVESEELSWAEEIQENIIWSWKF